MSKSCLVSFVVWLAIILTGCGGGGTSSPVVDSAAKTPQSGVVVSAPPNHSTVGTHVHYAATATTTCAEGVASMGIYTAAGALAYSVDGASLDTDLTLDPATYNTVVQEWDHCGGSATTAVMITVTSDGNSDAGSGGSGGAPPEPTGTTFSNLQQGAGWNGYALLPPDYRICTSCTSDGPETTWSTEQGVSSPSLSGSSMKFTIGGETTFSVNMPRDQRCSVGTGTSTREASASACISEPASGVDARSTPLAATRRRPRFSASRRSRTSSCGTPSRTRSRRVARKSSVNGDGTQRVACPGPLSSNVVVVQSSAA